MNGRINRKLSNFDKFKAQINMFMRLNHKVILRFVLGISVIMADIILLIVLGNNTGIMGGYLIYISFITSTLLLIYYGMYKFFYKRMLKKHSTPFEKIVIGVIGLGLSFYIIIIAIFDTAKSWSTTNGVDSDGLNSIQRYFTLIVPFIITPVINTLITKSVDKYAKEKDKIMKFRVEFKISDKNPDEGIITVINNNNESVEDTRIYLGGEVPRLLDTKAFSAGDKREYIVSADSKFIEIISACYNHRNMYCLRLKADLREEYDEQQLKLDILGEEEYHKYDKITAKLDVKVIAVDIPSVIYDKSRAYEKMFKNTASMLNTEGLTGISARAINEDFLKRAELPIDKRLPEVKDRLGIPKFATYPQEKERVDGKLLSKLININLNKNVKLCGIIYGECANRFVNSGNAFALSLFSGGIYKGDGASDAFEKLLQETNAPAERCAVVSSDENVTLETAKDKGIKTIFYKNGLNAKVNYGDSKIADKELIDLKHLSYYVNI